MPPTELLSPPRLPEHTAPPSVEPAELERMYAQPEVHPGPELTFVSWAHIPATAKATAERVRDSNVLAIELIGVRNERQRRRYERAATTFVSSSATPRQHRKAERYLAHNEPIKLLLDHLQGTDKRIVTLDINKDDPAYAAQHEREAAESKLGRQLHKPSEELRPLVLDAADKSARINALRENRMLEQVDDLVGQYRDTDAKIAVLAGAAHTPLKHELARKYHIKDAYAVGKYSGQDKRERVHFTPWDSLIRQRRLRPDTEAPEAIVSRAMLQQDYYRANSGRHSGETIDRSKVLEKISDGEVAELVVAADALKAGLSARLRRKHTSRKVGALISAKFDEVETRNKPHDNEAD